MTCRGYIIVRDSSDKDWKEGTKIIPEHPQRVSEESESKVPSSLLALLWFENVSQANQATCWKVAFSTKPENIDSYEYQWGLGLTVVKSFVVLERIVPSNMQLDGTLPLGSKGGKAVFYHGFLIGTCLPNPESICGQPLSFVYDPTSLSCQKNVDDLDVYLATNHSIPSLIGDLYTIRK